MGDGISSSGAIGQNPMKTIIPTEQSEKELSWKEWLD